MSGRTAIEKAALALPESELRQLVGVLVAAIGRRQVAPLNSETKTGASIEERLHPALLPVIGIIPPDAEAEGVHQFRLLKHA